MNSRTIRGCPILQARTFSRLMFTQQKLNWNIGPVIVAILPFTLCVWRVTEQVNVEKLTHQPAQSRVLGQM